MRAFILAAAAALAGAACTPPASQPVAAGQVNTKWSAGRTAYLTDGRVVFVQEDAHGVLRILQPNILNGRPVKVVNDDPNGDRPIVVLADEGSWRSTPDTEKGSGGDTEPKR